MTDTTPATATLLTPPGRGGIAVIALAGRQAASILRGVFRPRGGSELGEEGVLQLGHLLDGEDVLDEAIITRRGEVFEINIHGGSAVARVVLERLAACGAELTDAPCDVETFPPTHPRWNNPAIGRELLELLPQARSDRVVAALSSQWSAGLSELIAGEPTAEALRDAAGCLATMQRLLVPAEVVLAGPPNAGKSTLANALVGRAVSIIHETPGTTRDWVRALAIFDGVPVHLTDTAGLWQAPGAIDAESVRRARQCIETADVVVLLQPGGVTQIPDWLHAGKLLKVAAKCDAEPPKGDFDLAISSRTGQGLDKLRRAVLKLLDMDKLKETRPMAFTQRQADLLCAAAEALDAGDRRAAEKSLHQLRES